MELRMKKVNLIFKTHLDLGYTNTLGKVKRKYFVKYIKRAIRTADYFRKNQPDFHYVWTIGSWLLYEYLESASREDRKLVEEAVERGDIVWHALPFTTYSEMESDSMFRYSLSLAKELDKRFHKRTIAAKLADLPGTTRGVIEPLADAGIKLLHIGVNPNIAAPDLPPVFIWRDSKGNEIIVVYQTNTGAEIDFEDELFAIHMTCENSGPHSPMDVKKIMKQYPDAKIKSATLNDLARKLMQRRESLPVVTQEIGDTWIHGIASDPKKTADYKEMERLRDSWKDDFVGKDEFSRILLEIPEHTWGLDEKIWFTAPKSWTPNKLRSRAAKHFAASWREQRKRIKYAVAELPPDKKLEAKRALQKLRPFESIYLDRCITEKTVFENKFFRVEIDPDRACAESIYLKANKFEFKDSGLLYLENFIREDYDRFLQQYVCDLDDKSLHDFSKPDLPKDIEKTTYTGFPTNVYETVWGHGSRATLVTNALPMFRRVEIEYVFLDTSDELEVRLRWFGKKMDRLPHAAWFSFVSSKSRSKYMFRKMNEWVDPSDVVSGGARTLHAVEETVIDGKVQILNMDSPLVAPGKPSLLDFHNKLPNMKGGLHYNLYNNVWGTNFPMWYGDNMLFRYRIKAI